MSDHDSLVQQFCELAHVGPSTAQEYLTSNEWNLMAAVGSYFADFEESGGGEPAAGSSQQSGAPAAPDYTGPRTLDGRPAPQSALQSSSSSSKKPARKTGISTLNSLKGGADGDHDEQSDDDEDDVERKGPRDLFAGGEKSGLAVQDPARGPARDNKDAANVIQDILNKAKANAKRASADSEGESAGPARSNNFRGSGTTVGGEGTQSRSVPGRDVGGPRELPPVVTRTLHLWRDGFSIEDGPLRRYDDPLHAQDLQMIRAGRAPLHLMNVELNQRCDVRLAQHEEDWHQLPRIYRPFGGEGRRLGSPVPGDTSVAFSETASTPAPATSNPSAPAAPANVDNSQPTVAIRFQMPDGTRLPARFNLFNTVGDLYEFATNTAAEMRTRPFIIQSTFPSKDHTDREQKLEEVDAFKRGGIAVVRWA